MNQLTSAYDAQSTITALTFTDDTFVAAQIAADAAVLMRWLDRQIKLSTRTGMDRSDVRAGRGKVFPQTMGAYAKGGGNAP